MYYFFSSIVGEEDPPLGFFDVGGRCVVKTGTLTPLGWGHIWKFAIHRYTYESLVRVTMKSKFILKPSDKRSSRPRFVIVGDEVSVLFFCSTKNYVDGWRTDTWQTKTLLFGLFVPPTFAPYRKLSKRGKLCTMVGHAADSAPKVYRFIDLNKLHQTDRNERTALILLGGV